jgi:hypothetical protein
MATKKPHTFLNYSVSKYKGQTVVTAEYMDGFVILSEHKSLADAQAAMKRYEAADACRKGA